MKRWLLGLSAIVAVVVLALALWRSSSLIVERTVIAELPLGINRLIPTDLDGDGEPEILAVCSHWEKIQPTWLIPDYERIADPRIWLIRSPLEKPNATQLPYVCRWRNWDLSSSLPPQRSVLVEEGELLLLGFRKVWKASRLGWLKMTGEHLTFEPLLTVKGQVTHQLIANEKLLLLHYTRPFAFRLQPDGVWKPVDPKPVQQLLTSSYPRGDFDGDGLRDVLKERWLRSGNKAKAKWMEVHWGNGAPATVLFEERPPKSTSTWTADVEGDGLWEIVTWDGKDLTVWKFRKQDRRFVPIARLPLKLPSERFIPPSQLEPYLKAIDLNGDRRKDFVLFWHIAPFSSIWGSRPFPLQSQIVWWEGKQLKTRQFDPKEVVFSNPLLTTWSQGDKRFAIAGKIHKRLRFRPRLVSRRPLQLILWEPIWDEGCVIVQMPNGNEALDLRQWVKLAEFSAKCMSYGDWDSDGKIELLLLRRFWQTLPHWMVQQSPPHYHLPHDILYLVQCDGKKVRWAKILPPSPAEVLHDALPLKGRNGAAIFVVWELEDKAVVERLRWR